MIGKGDKYGITFMHVFIGNFSQAPPHRHVYESGVLFFLAGIIFVLSIDGHAQITKRGAVCGMEKIRIASGKSH